MNYSHKIIRKEELSTTAWSGGTTTQLAIYPETALYSGRNFLWRISTAKIEVEESVFTPLPNINRIIMVLDGEMLLQHEGHGELFLKPFQQNIFKGDWVTKSVGRVTDFNVMMAHGCRSYVDVVKIDPQASVEASLFGVPDKHEFGNVVEAFYFIAPVKVAFQDGRFADMQHGDVLILEAGSEKTASVIGLFNPHNAHVQVVRACIYW